MMNNTKKFLFDLFRIVKILIKLCLVFAFVFFFIQRTIAKSKDDYNLIHKEETPYGTMCHVRSKKMIDDKGHIYTKLFSL